ncbi:MAG TPA: DUF350 domain-containing protein [Thermoanaerobaculia bacterium]|jgi:uncharacterized membrane protein YjfL (UPF0719 family)
MELAPYLRTFLSTIVYTVFGLVAFGLAFWVIVKISPFSIRKELETDQNTAMGIVIGSVLLGLALIIGAAIHG